MRSETNRLLRAVACAGLLILLVSANIGSLGAQSKVLEQLQSRFNKDKGIPRLILLVSPT